MCELPGLHLSDCTSAEKLRNLLLSRTRSSPCRSQFAVFLAMCSGSRLRRNPINATLGLWCSMRYHDRPSRTSFAVPARPPITSHIPRAVRCPDFPKHFLCLVPIQPRIPKAVAEAALKRLVYHVAFFCLFHVPKGSAALWLPMSYQTCLGEIERAASKVKLQRLLERHDLKPTHTSTALSNHASVLPQTASHDGLSLAVRRARHPLISGQ